MLPPEAVMESHDRQVGSRRPWLGSAYGSGGCEFCPCHLSKRAVDLVQGDAISCGLADFILSELSWLSRPYRASLEFRFCLGALQRLSEFVRKSSAAGKLNSTPLRSCHKSLLQVG